MPCLLLAMRCAGCSVQFIIKKLTTRPSAVDLLEAYEALLVKQAAYIKAPVQHEGVLSPHFEVRCCGTSAGVGRWVGRWVGGGDGGRGGGTGTVRVGACQACVRVCVCMSCLLAWCVYVMLTGGG